jgi:hypothetical protein
MPPFFVQVGMEKIFLPPFNKNIISQSKLPGPKFEGRRNANESYSRARAAVETTSSPAAAALCFRHRRHLRIFFAPPLPSTTAVAPSDSP